MFISVVNPLDQFPQPSKNNQPQIIDKDGKIISDAISEAKATNEAGTNDEWTF